ncbi:MAG: hypothetical protein ACRD6R_11570 [Candidatus Polarisedimenticolia bacterium]
MNRSCLLRAAALLGAALLTAACGGAIEDPDSPVLRCDDSPPARDVVALRCGSIVGSDTFALEAVIGVPTTATDIAGFSFHVVFDPALLEFVPDSEQQGNLLNQEGDSVTLLAEPFASDPGRLVVGVFHLGMTTGVQGVTGRDIIMRFHLRTRTFSTFGPLLPQLQNGTASDNSGDAISGISFRDQMLLYRD